MTERMIVVRESSNYDLSFISRLNIVNVIVHSR